MHSKQSRVSSKNKTPLNPDAVIEIQTKRITNELWKRGEPSFLLDETQLEIYKKFHATDSRKFVLNCARRLGKSFLLSVIAIETALKITNGKILFVCPTQKQARGILEPLIKKILSTCPNALRPTYHTQKLSWTFHTGSELILCGSDGGALENLRGLSADLALVDEAGFVDELEYLISDILLPQTITTGGRIILASTPPRSPGHPFVEFIKEADFHKALVTKTIYDNKRIKPETIEEYAEECGGKKTSTWRREYLAEIIKDAESSVIPEFDEEAKKELVREVERPHFFDAYVSLDIGFKDFTAGLFAYYDFKEALLVIEDELLIRQCNTKQIAEEIAAKEKRLWSLKEPYMRVSDDDLIVIEDLNKLHGIRFYPTKKDNKEAAINNLRLLISSKQIVIHPRCVNLIKHLQYATWNRSRNTFDRTEEYGHYDLVDAAIYLVRNVKRGKNPYPKESSLSSNDYFISPQQRNKKSITGNALKKIFKIIR